MVYQNVWNFAFNILGPRVTDVVESGTTHKGGLLEENKDLHQINGDALGRPQQEGVK